MGHKQDYEQIASLEAQGTNGEARSQLLVRGVMKAPLISSHDHSISYANGFLGR